MKDIVILGNSIGAEILYGYLVKDARYNVVAFSVDPEYISASSLFGLEVVSFEELVDKYPPENTAVVLGMGYGNLNGSRAMMFARVKEIGYQVETYIHPTATVLNDTRIGEGSVVLASSVVEPFVEIGHNSFIWCNCTIAHHSRIGNHTWIASNTVISGQAQVDDRSFLGVGVVVANKVHIAKDNIIGGSAFITRNTKPKEVWLARSAEKHRFEAEAYAKLYLV